MCPWVVGGRGCATNRSLPFADAQSAIGCRRARCIASIGMCRSLETDASHDLGACRSEALPDAMQGAIGSHHVVARSCWPSDINRNEAPTTRYIGPSRSPMGLIDH